jgi:hypothetical protein
MMVSPLKHSPSSNSVLACSSEVEVMKRTIRSAEKIRSIETPQTVTADVFIGSNPHPACGEHSRTTAKSMRE